MDQQREIGRVRVAQNQDFTDNTIFPELNSLRYGGDTERLNAHFVKLLCYRHSPMTVSVCLDCRHQYTTGRKQAAERLKIVFQMVFV